MGKFNLTNKKNLYNLIMAAVILVLLVAGVLTAGFLRGWFGGSKTVVTDDEGNQRVVEVIAESKKGNVNLKRGGVSFTLEQGAALQDGDSIETRRGSAVTLVSGKNTLYLDERSQAVVHIEEDGAVRFQLDSGAAFGIASEPMGFEVMGTKVMAEDAVFSSSAPYGSASLHIFEKSLKIEGQEAKAGQAVSILQSSNGGSENEIQITELSLQSLSSFEIACAALVEEEHSLCFTAKELEELTAQRQQTVADVGEAAADGEASAGSQAAGEASENGEGTSEDSSGIGSDGSNGDGSNADANTAGPEGSTGTSVGGNGSGDGADNSGGGSQNTPQEPASGQDTVSEPSGGQDAAPEPSGGKCTIKIVCDTILNNMDSLAEGKDSYVPGSGVILSTTTVSFSDGETVFDVLKRACGNAGIQLEYSWTPMYNSYYVEGINNLYEFDCGGQSGWMFKVNGWFPNYGCSSYTLSDGDAIVWCYTCVGLGEDVGGSVY